MGCAVREAIAVLSAAKPLPLLQYSPGITLAARDHVRDLGPRGGLGHVGADGSSPGKRVSRHGEWIGDLSEAITFGAPTARDVVLELPRSQSGFRQDRWRRRCRRW